MSASGDWHLAVLLTGLRNHKARILYRDLNRLHLIGISVIGNLLLADEETGIAALSVASPQCHLRSSGGQRQIHLKQSRRRGIRNRQRGRWRIEERRMIRSSIRPDGATGLYVPM